MHNVRSQFLGNYKTFSHWTRPKSKKVIISCNGGHVFYYLSLIQYFNNKEKIINIT